MSAWISPVSLTLVLAALAVGVGLWRLGVRRVVTIPATVACVIAGVLLAHASAMAAQGALRFVRPWWLLLAGVAAVASAERISSLPMGLSRVRRAALWTFGTLAAILAAVAAAGPELGSRADRLTVVFAVDRSRSMELVARASATQAQLQREAEAKMRRYDRVARVVFGAEAATEDPAHERSTLNVAQSVAVGRDGTDLSAAIRRAIAEIPDESTGRVVLLTDGAGNRGDALAAAAGAASAGVPIDVVPMRASIRRNLRVEAARAPSVVDEGETFELRVVTRSTESGAVRVRVRVDGALTQDGLGHVEAGEDVLTLRQTATSAGLHRYEVDVAPEDPSLDDVQEDNRAGLFVRVRGASSVLMLEGDPGASRPFATALRQSGGFRVEERGANGFPEDLAALAGFDLVVISDVPARNLSPDQMEQLRTYVRDLGGGLLLMGGDRSFGPGGYSRTPVEEISPVSFDLRQERRRASLSEVISIDYSGSMTAQVGGYTKIQLANEAAARSAALLGPGDRLGVAHVDTVTAWTVALGPVTDLAPIAQRIRAVSAGGGGIIVPIALRDGYGALRAEHTNLRHLLLFADGDDAEEMPGCVDTAAQAYREGITTSVVSLGRGVDTPELERLAREGHGRFYLVEDALRLPTVFAQETILASRASMREETFQAALGAPDAATRGVDFSRAPPLHGYVVTIPKPRGSVLLTGPEGDPLLASWQVGIGRVGAFTSDAKDRWGAEWLTWPGAPQLWVSLSRSLVRRGDSLVRAEADTVGGVLHVRVSARTREGHADTLRRLTARVTGPDGVTRDLPLDPTGAGTYAVDLPLARPGAYAVGVRDDALNALAATTGALLLSGEEMRPAVDPNLLATLASMTGGRVLGNAREVFDARVGLRWAYTPVAAYLLWLSALALLLSVASRRLGLPDALARWIARSGADPARAPLVKTAPALAALLEHRRISRTSMPPQHLPTTSPRAPLRSFDRPTDHPSDRPIEAPDTATPPPAGGASNAPGAAPTPAAVTALLARRRQTPSPSAEPTHQSPAEAPPQPVLGDAPTAPSRSPKAPATPLAAPSPKPPAPRTPRPRAAPTTASAPAASDANAPSVQTLLQRKRARRSPDGG